MIRAVLIPALLTGIFCAGFALLIDIVTDMLARRNVIMVSFASGFLGSLFAHFVLGRQRK